MKCGLSHAMDSSEDNDCSWYHRIDRSSGRHLNVRVGNSFLLKGPTTTRKGPIRKRIMCCEDGPFVSVWQTTVFVLSRACSVVVDAVWPILCYLQFKTPFLHRSYIYLYSNIKK